LTKNVGLMQQTADHRCHGVLTMGRNPFLPKDYAWASRFACPSY
jgi:hypothetical protein